MTYNYESLHIPEITEMIELSDKKAVNIYSVCFKIQGLKDNIMRLIEVPNITSRI